MSAPISSPSTEVAAYLGASRALAALNRAVACSSEYIREIDGLLERNPYGLSPQQAADGFAYNVPPVPIFAHLGAELKALATLGEIPVESRPTREWLYAQDTAHSIATRVPWSQAPIAQGGVYATEAEAIAAAQAMLDAYTANGGVALSDPNPSL